MFARIDQHELAGSGLAGRPALAVLEDALGHDERHGQRVAVLRNPLAGRQAQTHDPHGAAIGDLLPGERPVLHRRRIIIGG